MVVGHHSQRLQQLQQDYPPSAGALTSLPLLLALWEAVPVLFRKILSFPDSEAQNKRLRLRPRGILAMFPSFNTHSSLLVIAWQHTKKF